MHSLSAPYRPYLVLGTQNREWGKGLFQKGKAGIKLAGCTVLVLNYGENKLDRVLGQRVKRTDLR